MSHHLVLVDGNNLGFSAMAGPRLSAGDRNTNGIYSFLKKIRGIYLDNPDALIMVLWDGRSWRKDAFADYKANRESTEKLIAAREEYFDQKKEMLAACEALGIIQASASNMEADDLAQFYWKRWKGDKITLVTADKDWLQLVDERTTWYDPIHERYCTDRNFDSFTGCKNVSQFLERKYLQGDAGDNLKGYKGLGPATLDKVYTFYDSILDAVSDPELASKWTMFGKLPKVLREINFSELDIVLMTNEVLMNLSTPSRPEPKNLTEARPTLNVEAFAELCNRNAFLSITRKLTDFIQPFKGNKYVRI
jgi:5'-3' exonuclease